MGRLLSIVTLTAAALALLASTAYDRPSVPPHVPLGDEVDLALGISGYDDGDLELELKEGPRGTLFLQFAIDARRGEAILNGAGGRRAVREMKELPNVPFLRSAEGDAVMTHPFSNQLVELEDGTTALRVRYTGRDVRLLRSLRVARTTTFPPFLGRALGHDGPIRLQRGTYPIEEDAGATIPVRLLGR